MSPNVCAASSIEWQQCTTQASVFAAPAQQEPERVWDQSNSARAVRAALDACGLTCAVPHTSRRTVATLLDQAKLPIARIADQLGHSDVSMTARLYLGRDLKGDKRDLAQSCEPPASNVLGVRNRVIE
jgi:hypothetical protein